MSAPSATLAGRRAAESRMRDTCRVQRVSGRVFDEQRGDYVETLVEVYAGACRIASLGSVERTAIAGERAVTSRTYLVHLPATTVGLLSEDVVTVETSELDPALPGTRLLVRDVGKGTQVTARRLLCEETVT